MIDFKIEEIAFAILEVNGSLSVIEKSQYRPLQTGDLKHLKTEKASLPLPVISDGKVMYESLSALNITLLELEQKISPVLPKDIFLMTLDRYGKKEVIMKEKKN